MQVIHRAPFGLMADLHRDVDRVVRANRRRHSEFVPSVDIYEEADRFVVLADLPGIDPAAIELTVDGDLLTIRGEREAPARCETATEHRAERARGRFERAFRLPETVAGQGYEAEYRHGVLSVSIPKAPEAAPYRIEVTAN